MEETLKKTPIPPGFRFRPTEQQIFNYYLTHKNCIINNKSDSTDPVRDGDGDGDDDDEDSAVAETADERFNVIKDVDFYNRDPFQLPEIAGFSYGYRGRKQHWYCYRPSDDGKNGAGRWRTRSVVAGRGFWKMKGKERNVFGMAGKGDNVLLGTRASFVFYVGSFGRYAVKTDWFMHQYALIDQLKAFALCRIFIKSRCESLSDHVPSSCAEGSVSVEHHISPRQHHTDTSDDVGDKACDEYIVGSENEVPGFPMRAVQELDNILTDEPISANRFEVHSDDYINDLMSEQDLLTILEGDFIELDDLSCPLSGCDDIR